MPVISKSVKLVIFSYFTTNEMLCKLSKLNKETRQLLCDKKESLILNIDCLNLLTPEKLNPFDESYLINFAPLINLTLKCTGQAWT
jgi:hypothetical protein